MRIQFLGFGVLCGLLVAGCALETNEETTSEQELAVQGADMGTALSLEAWAVVGKCIGSNVMVHYYGELTTTGSVDSADITVDGEYLLTVAPQDFEHDGRLKRWRYEAIGMAPAGHYETEVCATQSGAQGRFSKKVCTILEYDATCRSFPQFE